jgi:hypothetical protein
MKVYSKTFTCEKCGCPYFSEVHMFITDFKTVNFSDELIYDEKGKTLYKCEQCNSMYERNYIAKYMKDFIKKYKDDHRESREENI